MPELRLGELAAAAGAVLVRGNAETRADSYSIDTRTLKAGAVFFALRGARADGHAFLPAAARAGAVAAVVREEPPADEPAPPALLRVDDPVLALARCGAAARRRPGLRVAAVTGSAGKTTTKDLLAAGLGASRRVYRTRGNLNNHLGVPLSLLECPGDAEWAVIEMGMSAPGEIAALTRIADPDVALVTNVRPAHLEFFESVDGIAAAKGELYALLRPESVAVVNLDDERCRVQAARHAGARLTYGRDPGADVALQAVEDRFVPGAALTFRHGDRSRSLVLRLGGAHAALDALAALAGVVAAGQDLDEASAAMSEMEPAPGRGKVHRLAGGAFLVDESYNSNPAALESVIGTMRSTAVAGRKILVMGDMLELGPDEAAFHREAGEWAVEAGVRLLVGVGPRSKGAVEAARRARIPEAWGEPDAAAAARSVPPRLAPGDLVVVKGSRGVRLEQVVEAILRIRGEAR
ncbi:MAG: UDP-N-acetylmuramoyl-tripeptide--D-alanyl-D-alanine ligase [Acidobacteriia bacterium]|nr:UDP-N-acetylmuramoyl-tripeptide--D-alanyl-D-alanine ligase [Terriglobia bacterium]